VPVSEEQATTRSGARATLLLTVLLGVPVVAVVVHVVLLAALRLLAGRTPQPAGNASTLAFRQARGREAEENVVRAESTA
jgi:hypothetical protein